MEKTLAITLPPLWVTSILFLPPDFPYYLKYPLSFLIGLSIPILWQVKINKELAKQEGKVEEALRIAQIQEDWNIRDI